MTTDLRDGEGMPHIEINEDGKRLAHQGYEITYCDKCKKPIIHSRLVKIDNCGRKGCR